MMNPTLFLFQEVEVENIQYQRTDNETLARIITNLDNILASELDADAVTCCLTYATLVQHPDITTEQLQTVVKTVSEQMALSISALFPSQTGTN